MASSSVVPRVIPGPEIARNFIAHFSREEGGVSVNKPWRAPLDEAQCEAVREEAKSDLAHLSDPEGAPRTSRFNRIFNGNCKTIYEHEAYPNCLFKFMEHTHAKLQYEAATAIHTFALAQPGKFWIKIPCSTVIDLGRNNSLSDYYSFLHPAFYVEKRLKLEMNPYLRQYFWSHVLMHYESPECAVAFRENLKVLIQNVCTLIENFGFWDVGYRNLPEVTSDGKHVYAVDFDQIPLRRELFSIERGLGALIRLFSLNPELSQPLIQR